MGRKRLSDGGKRNPRLPYIAMCHGSEHGVPFRTFYKRMNAAERDAIETGATLTNLRTLGRRRFLNGNWQEC